MRTSIYRVLSVLVVFHSLSVTVARAEEPIDHAPKATPTLSQRFEEFKTSARQTISDFVANSRMNRRIIDRMETLDGAPLVQEDHSKQWSFFKYIAPNEAYGTYFEPCLPKQKGAYISVGTFRALNAGASGKVTPLILFDFDRGTKLFNQVMLQCVAMSRDRYEMMSLLFTGKRQTELIEKARAEKMNPYDFIGQLKKRIESGKIVSNWQALGIQVPKESDWDLFKGHIEPELRSDIPFYLERFREAGTTGNTFFGNDTRFNTLKKLVLDGQVSAVTGDLSDNNAFTHLSKTLREKGIQVSAMDISNANDYFFQKDGHKNFVNNLKSLPFVPGGKFLFTDSGNRYSGPNADAWDYYSVPMEGIGDIEKDFASGDYFRAERNFSVDPAPFNKRQVLRTRKDERCIDEEQAIKDVKKAAKFMLERAGTFRRMHLNH